MLFQFQTLTIHFACAKVAMISSKPQSVNHAGKLGRMSEVAFRFVLMDPLRPVSVSGDVEALLGFSEQDFLTSKVQFRDRVHAEDAALTDSLFSSDLTKPSGNFNIRVRHADGKIRCIRGHFKKEPTPKGQIQLELQLADARTVKEPGDESFIASFKSLIEQTTDYIYIKNRNHVILAASQTLSNLIELNGGRIELVGTTDYDNHPEADRRHLLPARREGIRRRQAGE